MTTSDTASSVRLMTECWIVSIGTAWVVGSECDMYLQYYRMIPSCIFPLSNPPKQGHSSLIFHRGNVFLRNLFRPLYLDLIKTKTHFVVRERSHQTIVKSGWGVGEG